MSSWTAPEVVLDGEAIDVSEVAQGTVPTGATWQAVTPMMGDVEIIVGDIVIRLSDSSLDREWNPRLLT